MLGERIEKLKQEYTGQCVVVDSRRPELARFAGMAGRVKTVNFNGCALVQFEGAGPSWCDIELDYLKVVDRPKLEPAEAPAEMESTQKLSRLELARLEKQVAKPGDHK